jgi:hypothetical protein
MAQTLGGVCVDPLPDWPQQEELTSVSRLSVAGSPLAVSLSMASVNFGK